MYKSKLLHNIKNQSFLYFNIRFVLMHNVCIVAVRRVRGSARHRYHISRMQPRVVFRLRAISSSTRFQYWCAFISWSWALLIGILHLPVADGPRAARGLRSDQKSRTNTWENRAPDRVPDSLRTIRA